MGVLPYTSTGKYLYSWNSIYSCSWHLAFFGAYATILIGMIYFGIQKAYGLERLKATFKSKMAIFLITFGYWV